MSSGVGTSAANSASLKLLCDPLGSGEAEGSDSEAGDGRKSHGVVLVTEDGVESTFSCSDDATILDAAAEAGLILPSACKAGGCGACTATLSAGSVEMADHDDEVVDPPEEEGGILLCSSTPRSDCRVELPYTRAKVATTPPAVRRAGIVSLDRVSAAAMRLRLQIEPAADGSTGSDFAPGQFVTMSVPGTDLRRSYSMANVANWDGELEFYIRLLPVGAMSDYLRNRAVLGDTIQVEGPKGAFELKENGMRPRWFLAGGTGLSPLLAMVRRMAEWGDIQTARLFHGVSAAEEVFGASELAEVHAQLPDFVWSTVVWAPGDSGDNAIDAAIAALADVPELPDVYVCGPPAMIEAARHAFAEVGLPGEQFMTEIFAPS